ncbi:peptidyl-prolyl cis-trans isomerase FKBP62-like [Coffea arabica]|uniref:Peptidyl-prolyl cis-trans isomerase FKBP62-like n=1 Tax=Coffea arabica TaxID=13443 RepID=A0ABM4UQU2_COFAR
MDTTEKLEACQRKKSNGNAPFKAGRFELASKKYGKEFPDTKLPSKSPSRNSNNPKSWQQFLEVDPCSVEALFRRSQAYLRTSDLEKAEGDIMRALAIDPNNREVRLDYQELKGKKRQYIRHEG